MFDNLKYIALSVALMAMVSACTSSGNDSTDEPEAALALKFAAKEANNSRASLTTNESLSANGSSFAVYGDTVGSHHPSATPTIIFNNVPVTNNGSAWSYENIQYWFPGQIYSFVAIHPADNGLNPSYSNNTLSFTYNQPTDYTQAVDILAATHRRRPSALTQSTVAFAFQHLLSRINFVAKIDPVAVEQGSTVTINSITLYGVGNSASFSIAPAPLSSGTSTDDIAALSLGACWSTPTELSTEQTPIFKIDTPVTLPESDGALSHSYFLPASNPLLIIPQVVTENVVVALDYTVYVGGSPNPKTATPKLMSIAVATHDGRWLPGMSYTYSFTIGIDDLILFATPTMQNWDESEGSSFII